MNVTSENDRSSSSLVDDKQYRLLVESVTDYAIYMLNPKGVVVSWNAGAQRFKGYAASEIVGRHFSLFYAEEDRKAGLPAHALETAAREGVFEAQAWRVRKNGERFWAHVVIDPVRDASGQLVGFAKITRDLSQQERMAESLVRSEDRFKLLVDAVSDYAIYMLDPQGRVTSWNAGAQRIKGYTADEIVGEHFSRFYSLEDRDSGLPQRALEISATEGKFESEGWRIRKDGSRFWASVVIDPIRDAKGDILGFAKVTRDFTERKNAEQALTKANAALLQSQKMEAIGQLTGGIAHDFNNLLAAVLGSLELLRKRMPDDPKMLRLLDNAVQGAQRGAGLTQRMLAFARQQDLAPEVIDLPALVRGMIQLLQPALGPSITLETRIPLALKAVLADANQLEMALLNLAVNARDAMPAGGPIVIEVREERVGPRTDHGLAPGAYACLSVTDKGMGMDATTVARAMEPFYTTKGLGKGTGLGLSMVHGMAIQVGGRLILKSAVGQGTTAELWLPFAQPDAVNAPVDGGGADLSKDPLRRVVLAVDDDDLVLLNTVMMLEDLGHRAFEANSAKQGLALLEKEASIELVVTDMAMPEMTGLELVEAARAANPHLRFILATGYAESPQQDGPRLLRLAKPFGQVELARAIAAAFDTPEPDRRIVKFPGVGR